MASYPVINFEQYGSGTADDRLLVFAAPAKEIAQWAGIPRKGWHVRMLYQRWVTPGRERELTDFWTRASSRDGEGYILGPTALTIAVHGDPVIADGNIHLDYRSPLIDASPGSAALRTVAALVFPMIKARLSEGQQEVLAQFMTDCCRDLPDAEHDYVLESAMQIGQMCTNPEWFIERHDLDENQVQDIIVALEALCRPALVVDGQHRLVGAAQCENTIWLPVVAVPNCPWTDQIYQFVVINEKAKPIETSLLTDIFGSSLTHGEQQSLRSKLERSNVSVEPRIAAVIASRDATSPFYNMVNIRLEGAPPNAGTPYVPESTIRYLIDGGRGTRGWRCDDEFYEEYVSPTFPERSAWDSWTEGKWRDYWFAFWAAVRDFYNAQAKQELHDENARLWDPDRQTNLTKSVSLRLFQALFIEAAIDRVERVQSTRQMVAEVLGDEELANKKIAEKVGSVAIPDTVERFREDITQWFLEKGVPVRFFLKGWKSSLDDAQGQADLRDEMRKAFQYGQEGRRYHTRNVSVFAVGEDTQGAES